MYCNLTETAVSIEYGSFLWLPFVLLGPACRDSHVFWDKDQGSSVGIRA